MSLGCDLVDHLGGGVAQHAFGADVEQLNDAFLIGGDDGEVGAVEDGVLQCTGLQQRQLAADFVDALERLDLWRRWRDKLACRAGMGVGPQWYRTSRSSRAYSILTTP